METIKRTLGNLFLDMSNPISRIIRRGLIIGLLTAVSIMLAGYAEIAPEAYVPVITAILGAFDKALREHK